MAPKTYGNTAWRGIRACGCMIMSIEDIIEPRLREAGYLGKDEKVSIFQGAYNGGGVQASAGTHDGGGAIDHAKGNDGETKIWRECGVADWQRGSPEDTAFDDHNHGIWQGCDHVSSGAADQVNQYEAGCNGLSGWGPDQSPHVAPISWSKAYDKYIGSISGGVLGMTDIEKYSSGTAQKFTGNDLWQTIKIDDEGDGALSIITGPIDTYMAVACLTWSGLTPGEVCQFRFQAVSDYADDRATTTLWPYPIQESTASEGSTFTQLVWANNLGDAPDGDAKSRLRLFVSPPKGKVVSVTGVTIRCLHD